MKRSLHPTVNDLLNYSSKVQLKYSINIEFRKRTENASVGSIRLRINHQGQSIRFAIPSLKKSPLFAWDCKANRAKTGSEEGKRIFATLGEITNNIDDLFRTIESGLFRKGCQLYESSTDFPYSPKNSLRLIRKSILNSQYVFTIDDFLYEKFSKFIEDKVDEQFNMGQPLAKGTIKQYYVTCNKIQEYEEKYGRITLKDLDQRGKSDFPKRFNHFLTSEKNYLASSKTKLFKQFNAFLIQIQKSNRLPYELRKFSYKGLNNGYREPVVLREDELLKIQQLTGLSERLEKVRKMFLIACWTGLRYSDWGKISLYKRGKDDYFMIESQKKKKPCIVFVSPHIKSYFEYFSEFGVPSYFRNTNYNGKVNSWIKQIIKLAKIERDIQVSVEQKVPIENVVSTHVARATFITLMLTRGADISMVMALTGHESEKEVKPYIRYNPSDLTANLKQLFDYNKLINDESNSQSSFKRISKDELFEQVQKMRLLASNWEHSNPLSSLERLYSQT